MEETDVHWVRRLILFLGQRRPPGIGKPVPAHRTLATASQNLALAARLLTITAFASC